MNNKLGIDSYIDGFSGKDSDTSLSLAWTSDEQSQLDIDLGLFLTERMYAEASNGAPLLQKYAVNDPYGAHAMHMAANEFLKIDLAPEQIFCAAGVMGWLNALSCLAGSGQGLCHVTDIYRDLPAWAHIRGSKVNVVPSLYSAIHQQWQILLIEHPSFLEVVEKPLDFLADACAIARARNAIVVIDESNANYLPPHTSLAGRVNQLDNLVVLRGFSKAYGLGALRLGVALCSRNITTILRSVITPLSVSPVSLDLGAAVWSQGDIMTRLRSRILTEKMIMKQYLIHAGIVEKIAENPYLPYVLLPADTVHIQTLSDVGITGKRHFTAGINGENQYYRLSVPLHSQRMQRFKELMGKINSYP